MMAVHSPRIRVPVPRKELNEFCQHYQIKRLALFGSVLRKDFRPESDVDVLVLFSPEARVGILTLSRMRRELSGLFNRRVDLVPMDGLKPVIREHVLSDIEEIYAA
jgi:predicted nucleotidyltransferase